MERAAYAAIIGASTAASTFWHAAGEPRAGSWLYLVDYGLAGVWAVADLGLAARLHGDASCWGMVCVVNVLVCAVNHGVDAAAKRGWLCYDHGHSAWHVLSAAKAVLVAWLLSC